MLWERKPIPITPLSEEFQGMKVIKQTVESTIYKGDNKIVKLQCEKGVVPFMKTFISSESPVSNGVESWVFSIDPKTSEKTFVGWIEKYDNTKTLHKNMKQDKILPQLIKHQIFLTKLGYHEMDMGVSNFFENGVMFDKGGVWHIKEIQKEAIEDINEGYFFKMMKNSFVDYPFDYEGLHRVLNTRDPLMVEDFYKKVLVPKKKVSILDKIYEVKQNLKAMVYRRLK